MSKWERFVDTAMDTMILVMVIYGFLVLLGMSALAVYALLFGEWQ